MTKIYIYIVSVVVLVVAFFYTKYIYDSKIQLEFKLEQAIAEHQATSNVLLKERLEAAQAYEEGLKIQGKLDEISKENTKYRNCIANKSCYISLRQQTSNQTIQTESSSSISNNDSCRGFDGAIQQDLFDLRASIKIDELKIAKLQEYINDYCYRSTQNE